MEGPSLLILKEELKPFKNEKIFMVSGNTRQAKDQLKGATLTEIQTWGKVLFLKFKTKSKSILTKTHFMMFGSYRINDPKPDRDPRLSLKFKNGRVDFYACSIKFDADDFYEGRDWEVDLMSKEWNRDHVLSLIKNLKEDPYLCDLFLDQSIFTGSGNIVKNEVLFNIRRHPLTKLSSIRKKDWPLLVDAVHDYMWSFYKWKKKFQLRRHWQVYGQGVCPLCKEKITREHLGKNLRRTFYCSHHQPLEIKPGKLEIFEVLPMKKTKQKEKRLDH